MPGSHLLCLPAQAEINKERFIHRAFLALFQLQQEEERNHANKTKRQSNKQQQQQNQQQQELCEVAVERCNFFFSPSIGCGSGRAAAVVRLWCSGDDVNGGIYARTAFSLAAAATQAAQQQLLLLFRWRNLYLPPVFVFLCALHSSLRLDTHTHAGKHSRAHTHASNFAYFSSLGNLFVYPADCCALSSP